MWKSFCLHSRKQHQCCCLVWYVSRKYQSYTYILSLIHQLSLRMPIAQFRCARSITAAAAPMSLGTPTRSLK